MILRRQIITLRIKTSSIWVPDDAVIIGEGLTHGIGDPNAKSSFRHRLDAGTYGTMGVGLGFAIAAAVTSPDKPIVSVQGIRPSDLPAWRSKP
ncbi:MAG: hypothetical protein Ct9H300mP8_12020 [Gammaproteobacteria bacterium]|nr:MAG: hypothetical protein Ct9H300mP8_12020 [Gammaproteobacteria bacterium]